MDVLVVKVVVSILNFYLLEVFIDFDWISKCDLVEERRVWV